VSGLDAVVVGSGPNGLAAALTLARAGLTVGVLEAAPTLGGGCRTEELTLPGYRHDVCSTVHALAAVSPFFRGLALDPAKVDLVRPEVAFAHPLDGGRAAAVHQSLEETVEGLGPDGPAYRRLMGPLAGRADKVIDRMLAPLRSARSPFLLARFGALGLQPATWLARRFGTDEGRAVVAGVAAHSMRPLDAPLTGGFGLVLALSAHAVGWPVVRGGSQVLVDALVDEIRDRGGELTTGTRVRSLAELPSSRLVLLDVTPRQFVDLAGDRLDTRARRPYRRFRYGPGVCKVDWALDGPVPWSTKAATVAGTVHVGGTLAEVRRAEAEVNAGRHPEAPFCLVVQPSIVDDRRAPAGRATLWAYCHVPSGSTVDMTARIEAQIERFAPGFTDRVLARSVRTAAQMEEHDVNYVGGDIAAGASTLRQTVFRPTATWNPYRTPLRGVYLCSSSTPPGGGVHGMCGLYAARTALFDHFGGPRPFRT